MASHWAVWNAFQLCDWYRYELAVVKYAAGPLQSVAMTGSSMHMASVMVRPQPSPRVGSTKASTA